ncbi:hypothetical protein MPSEU_000089700 [Mayamaea pseudoterrestris]|nr:hypothetical protein MPSEU_000089700 [Mayamaea pseudoterrestris]
MLKLTMNPRKRSKRIRNAPHQNKLPKGLEHADEQGLVETDMVVDNLHSLVRQESSGKYACADYLSLNAWYQKSFSPSNLPNRENPQPAPNTQIDEYCREQIVEWSFRVVDYFRIDREVVAISLSFLDRFLAKHQCDRASFKLAATTTLHLAVKLLYPCKLADLGILSDLSRGEFNMRDVADMENIILRALDWKLHPPTSIAFASLFLDYFFASRTASLSSTDVEDIYDVSSFFCELAVCEYSFLSMQPSALAIASILNALEGMFGPDNHVAPEILKAVHELGIDIQQNLLGPRDRLWQLYERSEECALHNDKSTEEKQQDAWHGGNIFVKKTSTLSPVSVTKPCHSSDYTSMEGVEQTIPSAGRRNGSW